LILKSVNWNNAHGPGGERAWALIITPDGSLWPFVGESIPGVVSVTERRRHVKYSRGFYGSYCLSLADGCRFAFGFMGLHDGKIADGFTVQAPAGSWDDVHKALGVSHDVADLWLRAAAPGTAKVLDAHDS
jgi:hypothetical protein